MIRKLRDAVTRHIDRVTADVTELPPQESVRVLGPTPSGHYLLQVRFPYERLRGTRDGFRYKWTDNKWLPSSEDAITEAEFTVKALTRMRHYRDAQLTQVWP